MMWRDVVQLIQLVSTEDGAGGYTETEVIRTVFANKKSIRSQEFYQAHAVGLKPEITFEIRAIDYDYDTKLRHEDKLYDILRTYSKNGERLDLICHKRTEVV